MGNSMDGRVPTPKDWWECDFVAMVLRRMRMEIMRKTPEREAKKAIIRRVIRENHGAALIVEIAAALESTEISAAGTVSAMVRLGEVESYPTGMRSKGTSNPIRAYRIIGEEVERKFAGVNRRMTVDQKLAGNDEAGIWTFWPVAFKKPNRPARVVHIAR